MDTNSVIIGSHFWFFREGDAITVPEAGVCAQEVKPGLGEGAAMDAGWIEMGTVEDFDPTASQEEYKLWKPSPGRLVLKDVLENKQELSGKMVLNDVSALAIETAFRSNQKLAGAQKQFNPLGAISRRGWGHWQFYDQADGLWFNMDLWIRLRTKIKFGAEPVKPEVEFFTLYSSLNTATIA